MNKHRYGAIPLSRANFKTLIGMETNDSKKTPIQVVRVEYLLDGNGYWNAKDIRGRYLCRQHSQGATIARRHDSPEYPNYDEDTVINSQIDYDAVQAYKFAFKTLDQFKVAFTHDELKECIELGFRIYLLTVDDYYESPYQVVFRNPISKEDVSNFFK